MKPVNQIRFKIYQIVNDNSSANMGGTNPQDNLIENCNKKEVKECLKKLIQVIQIN